MEKLGIDSIKNIVGAAFDAANRVIAVTAPDSPGGKKITLPEIIGSTGEAFNLARALAEAPTAIKQVEDLDDNEQSELEAWAEETLPVKPGKAKKIIVQSIRVIMELGELVTVIVEKDEEPTEVPTEVPTV